MWSLKETNSYIKIVPYRQSGRGRLSAKLIVNLEGRGASLEVWGVGRV